MSDSAKTTWKINQFTSIILVPLVIYLLVKIISLSKLPYDQIISELSSAWSIFYILIFTILGLFHMRQGVYEIMDDYVHNKNLKRTFKTLISFFILGVLTLVCLSLLLILMV